MTPADRVRELAEAMRVDLGEPGDESTQVPADDADGGES